MDVITDQIVSPSYIDDVAEMLVEKAKKKLSKKPQPIEISLERMKNEASKQN